MDLNVQPCIVYVSPPNRRILGTLLAVDYGTVKTWL